MSDFIHTKRVQAERFLGTPESLRAIRRMIGVPVTVTYLDSDPETTTEVQTLRIPRGSDMVVVHVGDYVVFDGGGVISKVRPRVFAAEYSEAEVTADV